jgi:pantoate--beta-alanine ligase
VNVLTSVSDLRAFRRSLGGTFGLVPTMGALHAGHLSLIARAHDENDHTGVSIFVNPAQFGPSEDFPAYPRKLERDLALLEPLGVDVVWVPAPADVYPSGFQTGITVDSVSVPLEGTRRPGHFRGVATVVAKLFNVFGPDRAYFGQKDAQQVAVIRRMARDLDIPVEIVVCPIVRETDGLAMSSRNELLGPEERPRAPVLFRSLEAARAAFESGERDAGRLRRLVSDALATEPIVRTDYVSIADPETLAELDRVEGPALLSLAARLGPTRLIDNVLLGGT